jgi:hypothetical protein
MQPLLSWAESKIFGGLHIVLCGWIRFTPRRMMWVMLLCFLLSPSILKNKGNKGKNKEGEEEHCNSHYERLNRKTILQWLFFCGAPPISNFPSNLYPPLSDSQAVDGAHLICQEDTNIMAQGTNKLGALETWQVQNWLLNVAHFWGWKSANVEMLPGW